MRARPRQNPKSHFSQDAPVAIAEAATSSFQRSPSAGNPAPPGDPCASVPSAEDATSRERRNVTPKQPS
jgi:hypothetical protein